MLEAHLGSYELRLFCLHFDNTLLLTLARISVDLAQVLQGLLNKESQRVTHNQCGSTTERPQASLCYPWGHLSQV